MSVYIKGMEIPVCHFKTSESYNVHGFWMVYPDGKSKLHIMVGSDHWGCEAIPVPDHGRLIEAFDTVKKLTDEGYYNAAEIVTDMPTIIPADHIGDVNEMVTDKEDEG